MGILKMHWYFYKSHFKLYLNEKPCFNADILSEETRLYN